MAKRTKNKKQIRNMKKGRLVLVSGGIMLLITAFFFFNQQASAIKPGDGVLSTPVSIHDFGVVPVSKGRVSVELPLVNIGDGDLIISFLDSSCGCTTARIINGGESGPVFGMSSHGRSPGNWRTTIKSGKQAILKIYYDPSVHPKFRGLATRVITITSNEKTAIKKQVRIKVTQVD